MVAFCSSDFLLGLFVLYCVSSVSGDTRDGFISSLGDVNGDKSVDIVTLSYIASRDAPFSVNVGLWNSDKFLYDITEVLKFDDWSNGIVTGSYMADFDSDGHLDLLLTSRLLESRDSDGLSGRILWGNGTSFTTPSYSFSSSWCSEYLVADVNGDEVPDVVAKECNASFRVWISNVEMRNFTARRIEDHIDCLSSYASIDSNISLALVDINQDLMADMVVINQTGASLLLSVFIRLDNGDWKCCMPMQEFRSKLRPLPSFTDFDADGMMDIVLPTCLLPDCSDSSILVMLNTRSSSRDCPKFEKFNISLSHAVGDELHARFGSIRIIPSVSDLLIPAWIRVGDYNLDTYPDVMIVTIITSGKHRALLLENTGCSTSSNCVRGRTLKHHDIKQLAPENGDVNLALFHNFDSDGDLDILLNVIDAQKVVGIQIVKNTLDSDANFLRVDVMTAACVRPQCKKHIGYGVSQLGATVEFSTTKSYDSKIRSISGQISKSGSFSCSLPYVIFGLSRSSTFVERLTVGIPYVKGRGRATKSRSSIIPNSHLYIIPQPSDDPSSWRSVLLINPSGKVLDTLIVFMNTCVVFGVIVGLLHWREKRQDEREKRQDAHKFHFDAM